MIKKALTLLGVLACVVALATPAFAGKPDRGKNKKGNRENEKACTQYSYYDADSLDKCRMECTGKKAECVMKQSCGGKPCPDPGYCWMCAKK